MKNISNMEIFSRLIIVSVWWFAVFWFFVGTAYATLSSYHEGSLISTVVFALYSVFILALVYPVTKEILFPRPLPEPEED